MDEKALQPVEHSNQRILTTAQLAAFYDADPRIISNNFNRNKDRYTEGKHYFCLEGKLLKAFKAAHQIDESLKSINKLYLWTEKGALMHAKSLNTDKAWEVYEDLVETYFRKSATPAPRHPRFNNIWEDRKILFHQETKLPAGYWCVFEMVAGFCEGDEYRNVMLIEQATPDISVGLKWCQHLRECGFDMSLIQKYEHVYPDKRGRQPANIYPNAWLGEYWTWFHGTYLEENYPSYLKGRMAADEPRQIA